MPAAALADTASVAVEMAPLDGTHELQSVESGQSNGQAAQAEAAPSAQTIADPSAAGGAGSVGIQLDSTAASQAGQAAQADDTYIRPTRRQVELFMSGVFGRTSMHVLPPFLVF